MTRPKKRSNAIHASGRICRLEPLEVRRLLSAATYYVSPTGSDSATGDATHPFATLQHASDRAVAGDTVDVRAGQYAGFVRGWNGNQDGTAAAPVTFHAESGATIVSPNAKTADGIDLEGASYIVLDGFTVNNQSGAITRAGIRAVNDTGVVIRNNTTDHNGEWGIFTAFSQNVDIEHNVASNSKVQHGIYVSNSADNPIIRGNLVFGNADCGIQINADLSQGGDGIISGAIVEGNIVHDNGVSGGAAINLDGVQNSRIRYNYLYNNHAGGIALFQGDGAQGPGNDVVQYNKVLMAANARWALQILSAAGVNTASGNVLLNANPANGSIDADAVSAGRLRSDYNVLSGRFTMNDGDSILTLAKWSIATHQDRHSRVG
jgi:parallel beta-helix repeat protein